MVATRAQDHLHEDCSRRAASCRRSDQDAARRKAAAARTRSDLMGRARRGLPGRLAVEEIDYPFFESAVLGVARRRAVAALADGPPDAATSVASRDYFKAVRTTGCGAPGAGAEGGATPYFVQAVRTFSKGETRAVDRCGLGGVPGALMASITTSLVSITQPVPPPRVDWP